MNLIGLLAGLALILLGGFFGMAALFFGSGGIFDAYRPDPAALILWAVVLITGIGVIRWSASW